MFQKKKEVEPAPIPLSDKEIKSLKENLIEKKNLKNLNIRDLSIEEILPQAFDGTVVNMIAGRHVLFLESEVTGDKFKSFRKSKGGIFNKDILDYSRGKESGNYVLIEGGDERKIIRLIKNDELHIFKLYKLVNGKIKDTPYMTLRNLSSSEKLAGAGRYIKENREHETSVDEMSIEAVNTTQEDDFEPIKSSVSLFSD